ncbi:glycerol-3-phosphate acyltransferase [Chloroflexota bacterium]
MEALAITIGYLLGSIPFAYIAGQLIKGTDIRQLGGGNVGALNTMREVGTVAGFAVLLADMAKGTLAVLVAHWLGLSQIFLFIVGFAAVVGHNWPVFLKFNGGMGASTTLGVLLALTPFAFGISFAIMTIVVFITSNMRLGMGIGAGLPPPAYLVVRRGRQRYRIFTGASRLLRIEVYTCAKGIFCQWK